LSRISGYDTSRCEVADLNNGYAFIHYPFPGNWSITLSLRLNLQITH
jgi:hypothetical protein